MRLRLFPRSSPVQLQGLHAGGVGGRARGGRGRVGALGRLPQRVVLRPQLAQVISGEVGPPGTPAVRGGLPPQRHHLLNSRKNSSETGSLIWIPREAVTFRTSSQGEGGGEFCDASWIVAGCQMGTRDV